MDLLNKLLNRIGYRSEKEVNSLTESIIESTRQEAINSIPMSQGSLYDSLEQMALDKVVVMENDLKRTADLLDATQAIYSNSFLSPHSNNDILRGWAGKPLSTIADQIASSMNELVWKARDLEKNSPLTHRIVETKVNNIVGEGFSQEIKAYTNGKVDNDKSEYLEKEFLEWCLASNCDVTGRLSLQDIQRQHARVQWTDGEALVRKIRDSKINKWGFALQTYDAQRIDTMVNVTPNKGKNTVYLGVELNSYDKPIAYYIREGFNWMAAKSNRLSSSDVYHLYMPVYPGQVRGMPLLHAIMLDAKQLESFLESNLFKERAAANTIFAITQEPSQVKEFADGRGSDGRKYKKMDGGTIITLKPGEDITPYTPPSNTNVAAITKVYNLRIAIGSNSTYSTVTGDYSDSNYSASRMGAIEERTSWKLIQRWYIDSFLIPLYQDWLIEALKNKALVFNGKTLTVDDYLDCKEIIFKGKRWVSIDPVKDLAAGLEAYKLGILSLSDLAEDLYGMDLQEVWTRLKSEKEQYSSEGLPISAIAEYELIIAKIEQLTKQPEKTVSQTEQDAQKAINEKQAAEKRSENEIAVTRELINSISVLANKETPAPVVNLSPTLRLPGTRTEKVVNLDPSGTSVTVIETEVAEKE